jgi:hypothetical protein
VASFTADGAFDSDDAYAEVATRHPDATVIVPPRSGAVPSATAETAPTQHEEHVRLIAERGRMGWQKASGYNVADCAHAPPITRDRRGAVQGLVVPLIDPPRSRRSAGAWRSA